MKKSKKIPIILITITLIIVSIIGIAIYNNHKKEIENNQYHITYTSIQTRNNAFYGIFEIDHKKDFTIYATDFSIMINNIPITANALLAGTSSTMTPNGLNTSYIHEPSIDVKKDGKVYIFFDYETTEVDSPITFLYKGKKLPIGEKITFNIN